MDNKSKPEGKAARVNLQLQMDEETAQGRYANFAIVNHSPSEFVLDFVFVQPNQPRGKVLSRILTSPVHAKRLMLALQENMKRYEQRFGTVEIPTASPSDPVVH